MEEGKVYVSYIYIYIYDESLLLALCMLTSFSILSTLAWLR